MKVLLIWLGKMGQFHLQNLLNVTEIEKIYAFDVFEEAFKIKNEKINYSTNLEDFENLDYDFVDIVAPTKFHYFYLEKFIKLNKNIFVEKPLVATKEELEKLDNLIKETNYNWKIWVWFIERFNVVSKFLKEKINELWKPKLIEIFRYNPASWRIQDVDVTTDLMIHDIDLIKYFLEDSWEITWKNVQIDTYTVLLKSQDTNITLSANRITQQKIRRIKFYYDSLTIDWDLMLAKLDIYHKPSEYLTSRWQDLSISYLIEEKYLMKNNQLLEELQEFIGILKWWEYDLLADYESWKQSIYMLNKVLWTKNRSKAPIQFSAI